MRQNRVFSAQSPEELIDIDVALHDIIGLNMDDDEIMELHACRLRIRWEKIEISEMIIKGY